MKRTVPDVVNLADNLRGLGAEGVGGGADEVLQPTQQIKLMPGKGSTSIFLEDPLSSKNIFFPHKIKKKQF